MTDQTPRRSFVECTNLSAIIICVKRRTWYPRDETLQCLQKVKDVLGSRPVVTYGSSMGGYAAIKFANALKASHVISLAPQFSLDPNKVRLRSDPFIRHFSPELNAEMDISSADARCKVDIAYDPTQENDREHVGLIRGRIPHARLTSIKHAGHPLELLFCGPIDLSDLISFFLRDDLLAVAALSRRNKRRSNYFHMTLYRAICDRKPRAARWALTTAAMLPTLGTDDSISRSEALLKLGRPKAAATDLRERFGRASRDSTRWAVATAMSSTLFAIGNSQEAVEWLRRAASYAPGDENVQARLATGLLRSGNRNEALAIFGNVARDFDTPSAHFGLSQALAQQEDLPAAAAAGWRACLLNPANHVWRAHLAALLERLGRPGEAESLHAAAIRSVGDAGSWFEWSRHLHVQKRLDQAVLAAHRAVRLSPSNMAMRKHLSNLLLETGQLQDALAVSRASVETWLGGRSAFMQLALVLERLGDVDAAIKAAQRSVAEENAGPGHWAALINLLLRANKLTEAEAMANLAENAPCISSSALDAARAHVRYRRGDIEGAIVVQLEAVDKAPDHPGLLGALASYFLQAGRLDEAELAARRALSFAPTARWSHNTLLETLERRGDWQEAIAAGRQAIEADPAHAPFRNKLARFLFAAERFEEAREVIEDALDAAMANGPLHALHARLLLRGDDAKGAAAAARRGIVMAPTNAGLYGFLARALLREGCNEDAEGAAREAVRLQPNAVWLQQVLSTALEHREKKPKTAEQN
jgi:tetratricopeptide (TPR) repeat protein